jgi:hypothetical protein
MPNSSYINRYLKPGHPDQYYDPTQLKDGWRHEMEHTNSKQAAKLIAKHHLDENKDYYKILKKCMKNRK